MYVIVVVLVYLDAHMLVGRTYRICIDRRITAMSIARTVKIANILNDSLHI
jgi:hypothetical protein